MPERGAGDHENYQPLPESTRIVEGIAGELSLDAEKKPILFEGLPEEQLFPEEAPTLKGRYLAGVCLEEIYDIVLRYTPSGTIPDPAVLLSTRDIGMLFNEFRQVVAQAWWDTIPAELFPEFELTHLLGAAKRQIARLSELKHFHESDVFDPALRTYGGIAHVIEGAISDDGCNPLLPGENEG